MIKTRATYYVGNTNYFEVTELKNSITNAYENNATVTMTMKYINGEDVDGAASPLLFASQGSNGHYLLSFELDEIIPGDRMIAKVIAIDNSGFKKEWDVKVIAKADDSDMIPCSC